MEKAILNRFQFHKGTIDTLQHQFYQLETLFQFHKGTIDTKTYKQR